MRRPSVDLPAAVLPAVVLVVGLALGACSTDDLAGDPADGPGGESSTTSATEESSSPTSTPSPTPSTIAPALGPELVVPDLAVNAPDNWREVEETLGSSVKIAVDPVAAANEMIVISRPFLDDQPATTDEIVRSILAGPDGRQARRMPDVLVDGEPMYHVVGIGEEPKRFRYEEFGLHYGRLALTINLTIERSLLRSNPDLIDRILASVRIG